VKVGRDEPTWYATLLVATISMNAPLKQLSADLRIGQEHHQNWYVVALSEELPPGGVLGVDFLNGRVAVYRRQSGDPVVVTARCPHLGADLSLGVVVGDDLRCSYHHFCFGPDGGCTSVPSGERAPRGARVFSYPCVERFGMIWAFNGETPLFPPPNVRDFAYESLVYRPRKTDVFSVAPWVNIGNSFDFMHLRYVHGLSFEFDPERVRWIDDFHIEHEIQYDLPELAFESRIRVSGTNTVSYVTVGRTTSIGLFTLTPVGTKSQSYFVSVAPAGAARSDEDVQSALAYQDRLADALLVDDVRTLTGIRFHVGSLVKEDRPLVDFLKWVNEFPSSAPAARFE
jgi:phenylpropionate dioxygenase-like ring-hydroxylating dioxygenase large terminal subunit